MIFCIRWGSAARAAPSVLVGHGKGSRRAAAHAARCKQRRTRDASAAYASRPQPMTSAKVPRSAKRRATRFSPPCSVRARQLLATPTRHARLLSPAAWFGGAARASCSRLAPQRAAPSPSAAAFARCDAVRGVACASTRAACPTRACGAACAGAGMRREPAAAAADAGAWPAAAAQAHRQEAAGPEGADVGLLERPNGAVQRRQPR